MLFQKPLIALDIGSTSVKACEISGSGSSRKLKNLGLELLPNGTIVNGDVADQNTLVSAIRKLLNSLKIKTKGRRVAISLAGNSVLLKRMVILASDGDDPGEQVFEEAKQQFHHDMNDMHFRYHEIESAFTQPGEKAYLVAAGKIDTIEQYIDCVHKLGMKVAITDADVFCLMNMFEFAFPQQEAMSVIANIGATSTQVILTYAGEYLYSREFSMGGINITHRISQDMNIDFENAEGLKISASTGDNAIADKVRGSIDAENTLICDEIKQSIDFFIQQENIQQLSNVNAVYLAGGGAGTLGLAGAVSSRVQAPVHMLNPFQKIESSRSGIDMDYLVSQGALFGISAGLGIRKTPS